MEYILFGFQIFGLFCAALAFYWVLGRGWTGLLLGDGVSRSGYAPLIGFCLHIVLLVIANFLNFRLVDTAAWQLAVLLALGALGYAFAKKFPAPARATPLPHRPLHYLWPVAAILAVVFLTFLSPLLLKMEPPAWGSVHYQAGDYYHYWSHGFWFQRESMAHLPSPTAPMNPVWASGNRTQSDFIRFSPELWLAQVRTLTGASPDELFSFLVGLAIVFQSLIVSLLVLRASKKRRWAVLGGLLYGLHPLIVWCGYGSYLPQSVGFALALAVLNLVIDLPNWRQPLRLGALVGFLVATLYSAYTEMTPILFLVCFIFTLWQLFKKELRWRELGFFALSFFGVFFLCAGICFAHLTRGLWVQITGDPHGGDQSLELWALGSVFFGFNQGGCISTEVPIRIGAFQKGFFILSEALLVLTWLAVLLRQRRREIVWITLGVFAALAAYVCFRYTGVLKSWNMFKALNYAVPFLWVWFFLALVSLRGAWRLLWVFFLVPYALAQVQFRHTIRKHSRIITPPQTSYGREREAFMQALSDGDFYIASLRDWPDLYTALRPLALKNVVSFWDMPSSFWAEDAKGIKTPVSYTSNIRYVFCQAAECGFYPGRVRYADKDYAVVDAQGTPLVLPVYLWYTPATKPVCRYFYLSHPEALREIVFMSSLTQRVRLALSAQLGAAPDVFEATLAEPYARVKIPEKYLASLGQKRFLSLTHEGGMPQILNNPPARIKPVEVPLDLTQWARVEPRNSSVTMTVEPHSFALEAPSLSNAWLLNTQELPAGYYYFSFKVKRANVTPHAESPQVRPLFFGIEGDSLRTLRIEASMEGQTLWYPFSTNGGCTRFVVGLGGWCNAQGSARLEDVRLYKVADASPPSG